LSLILRNGLVVTPKGVFKRDIAVKNGYIAEVSPSIEARGEVLDCDGCYVVPGFREQHMHDINGLTKHPDDPERVGRVAKALIAHGVTAFNLATSAMPMEELLTYLKTCKAYMGSEENGVEGARLEGAYVEGTFINRACAGAQPPDFIVHPDEPEAKDMLDSMLETGAVKLVNIVPDFGTELIAYAVSKGVIVGCGHTRAPARLVEEAFGKGLRFIVHMTNGAMGQSFKPFDGGGAYEAALTLPLYVELITDGYHVDFRYVSDIIERRIRKGRMHEVVAVTDQAFPIRSEIPRGEFRFFSTVCFKHPTEEVLVTRGYLDESGAVRPVPPNTLCSSLLTMDRAFQNLVNMFTVRHSGFMIDVEARSLEEAVWITSQFTSTNSARLEGLADRGVIEEGKVADLTVLRVEGEPGCYKVKVEATVVGGNLFRL